jgi:hypothetical protein
MEQVPTVRIPIGKSIKITKFIESERKAEIEIEIING